MQFDLENLNEGTWFDIGSSGASICLRGITADDARRIRKETTKKKREFRQGQVYTYDEENEDKFFELLYDYYIVDWKNIVDKDGNVIPCTKPNKILLMGKSAKFASIVNVFIEKLNKSVEDEKEELEKN